QRMEALLARITVPVVLVWIADQSPPIRRARADLKVLPLLVDGGMIAALRSRIAGYAEIVLSHHARGEGVAGMAFAPPEAPLAREAPGPAAHREVAAGLVAVLDGLL
ncbi:MAG: DUF6473 family protein, partial [Pseudomonadota bacterium]